MSCINYSTAHIVAVCYRDQATGWRAEESEFDFRHRKENSLIQSLQISFVAVPYSVRTTGSFPGDETART